jgi:exodeoxyribonuclease V beta subunit
MLERMLRDVLHTPLPVGSARPLVLADVTRKRRLTELEFHLPSHCLQADALNMALAELGYAVPRLAFGTLRGYLKGFIDLVFEHDGRYFIADWKSNHLGDTAADYAEAPLAAAMFEHGYHLQSLLYCLALDRLLQRRVAGYDFARHFGGVLYLFVRGLRPGWTTAQGAPAGLHFHCPQAATIRRLSALFDDRAAA